MRKKRRKKASLKERLAIWYFDNYQGPYEDLFWSIYCDTGKGPMWWEKTKIRCWLWWDIFKCSVLDCKRAMARRHKSHG